MIDVEQEEIALQCPYCPAGKESKLNVNVEKGVFHCFRCGWAGKISSLAKKHPNLFSSIEDSVSLATFSRLKAAMRALKPREISQPVLRELKSVSAITDTDPHYQYLLNRGWTDEIINLYVPLKSETEKFRDRVIIPVVDPAGIVVYFTARDITGTAERKYMNPVRDKDFIFTSKTPVDTVYTEDAFICEGIFDAFKIPGACSLLGKTLNKAQHVPLYNFLRSRKNIYICLDPGAEKDSRALAAELDSWFVDKTIYTLNWGTANTSIDLGDLSKHQSFKSLVKFIKSSSSEIEILKFR